MRHVQQVEPLVIWSPTLQLWDGWDTMTPDSSDDKKATLSHPCPKPLRVCRAIVRKYTSRGVLVVDPFCGSGTIPLACHLEGRDFLGIDQDAEFVTEARGRLAEGQNA
jgi:DNA modification methylase